MPEIDTSLDAFDARREVARISNFIKDRVSKSRASGVVVGISGGVDSAVSAFLGTRALGKDRVLGLLLFEQDSKSSNDYLDAKTIISKLQIRSKDLTISPAVAEFKSSIRKAGLKPSKFTLGNIKARCRMVLLYSFANQNNLLVLGTGDRSEEEIGYFTKFGDGGVDLQPIAHLFKSQVKQLAKELGVPSQVIAKPSSPHLWKGHQATDEIPIDYPSLDKIISLLYDRQMKPTEVARKLGVPNNLVSNVVRLHEKSVHKREVPFSLVDSVHG
jgi:NAD+ synthase